MIKMQGCISKSTEIMSSMNQLMNIPEMSATMMSMQREMERAGLVEEIFNETFDAIGDESKYNI
jgi:charged multivesicular body protein 3